MLGHNKFLGMIPKVSPRLLPDTAAQIAADCWIDRGSIRPIPHLRRIEGVEEFPLGTIAIYRYSDFEWFAWAKDVDVAPAPVTGDDIQRVIWTGDGYPRHTTREIIVAQGFKSPGVPPSRRLGVPAPTGPAELTPAPLRIPLKVITIPVIGSRSWRIGQYVNEQLPAATVSEGSPSLSYTVSGLPPGLFFNPSTRRITGTPLRTASGAFDYGASASGYQGTSRCINYVVSERAAVRPNAPAGLGHEGTILSWNAVQGATSYQIKWHTTRSALQAQDRYDFTGITATSFNIRSYRWVAVRAVNGAGPSPWSDSFQMTEDEQPDPDPDEPDEEPDDPEIPPVPTGLRFNQRELQWNASQGATSYDIKYSYSEASANAQSYPDFGNRTRTTFDTSIRSAAISAWWSVRAVNSAGRSAWAPAVERTYLVKLATPTGLNFNEQALRWSSVPGATHYDIKYSFTQSGADAQSYADFSDNTGTSFDTARISTSGTWWSVRAKDSSDASRTSDWAPAIQRTYREPDPEPEPTTPPLTPTGLSWSRNIVQWAAAARATTYELEFNYSYRTQPSRATGGSRTIYRYLTVNAGSGLSYSGPLAGRSGRPFWEAVRVRARNAHGVSSWSSWVNDPY
ncbi:putative Ig domain-containing protein [Candidatus Poriferisocius sp.]|uniref:Ig domain-containing protein n=1 Tax=Candidatus Poriferisocius sp. TaxID=3101276 RepID=UPI003B0134D9